MSSRTSKTTGPVPIPAETLPGDQSRELNGLGGDVPSATEDSVAGWLLRNAGKWSDLPPEIMELIDV